MLDIDNQTLWGAGLYPGWGRDGHHQFTAVVKAGFVYGEQGRLTAMEEPPEIEGADRYGAEAGRSSLVATCETVPFKDGAEILLYGTALPPAKGARVMEVSLGLRLQGDRFWEKTLRIFGRRRWHKGLLGVSPGEPEILEPVPLIYENAYGGADPHHPERFYRFNPVGRGYSEKGWRTHALELPLIEIGPRFINSPNQRVQPAGFGALPPTWEPRLQSLSKKGDVELGGDGNPFGSQGPPPGIYNAAPLDQRFEQPFRGGETLRLKGFDPEHEKSEGLLLHLPVLRPDLQLICGGRARALEPVCDTLLVHTDHRQIHLLWRAPIPWAMEETRTGWVLVQDPTSEELPRAAEGGRL